MIWSFHHNSAETCVSHRAVVILIEIMSLIAKNIFITVDPIQH